MSLTKEETETIDDQIKTYQNMIKLFREHIKRLKKKKKQ